MPKYRRLIIKIPDTASESQLDAVYKALAVSDAIVRVPFGSDITQSKLIILDQDGNISMAQG